MEPIVQAIANNFFWTVMGTVAIVAIVGGLVRNVMVSSARQKTAREVAAYVAEGSMTPEDAQGILNSTKDGGGSACC